RAPAKPPAQAISRREGLDLDRLAAGTPLAGLVGENAGEFRSAALAGAVSVELVGRDPVAVAADGAQTAGRAEGRLARRILDIADIDMMETVAQPDAARLLQRRRRRRGN